ncbi:MAG: choice-of-anchor B family protein, partial [Planctomycetota bacterium]|nr:choice-of-anchor B family protein [Planctomycetota bacterium]
MGLSNKLVVVEVSDPDNPTIVGQISHTNTLWADIKVYLDRCYVVNDNGGGGMDVVDLSDVDNGNVTLVQRFTGGGLSTSHNVAIDEESGFLYLCGSNLNGGRLIAYDLSNPDAPVFAGQVSGNVGANVHDAQIVTYTSGPYAGRQIAFCANPSVGLDIYDVTIKSSIIRLSRTSYPMRNIPHQCWLSEDRSHLYLGDEGDETSFAISTRTLVFDVSDLENPVLANTFTSGLAAIDHNMYFHNGFIYEANYTTGLRIFQATDPVNPVEVAWFDTYPGNNNSSFNGAWSVYPFFPSGTIIVSDLNRGLFVLRAGDILAPEPSPTIVLPIVATETTLQMTATIAIEGENPPVEYFFKSNGTAGSSDRDWDTDPTHIDTGLSPDIGYVYRVMARDAADPPNETNLSPYAPGRTHAAVPGAPFLSNPTESTLEIEIDPASNPSVTTFAVQCTATSPADPTWSDMYVNAAGAASAVEDWQTASQWDTTTIQSVQPNTQYSFAVKAMNQVAVQTAFGPEA